MSGSRALTSVLDLNGAQRVCMHTFFLHPIKIPQKRFCLRLCAQTYKSRWTFSAYKGCLLHPRWKIAHSRLADKCVDVDRYHIVRTSAREGLFLFSLSLFCALAFCQGEMPSCLPDRSVSPSQMLMWLQGLWMGNETRALSEDPVLHLLSPLSQLFRSKPVSCGVC